MHPRTVVVTGGNAGLGFECAKRIAGSDPDYHVVLACRSVARGQDAASRLRAETGNSNVVVMELDLASLASVRRFYDDYCGTTLPALCGVVCNAGVSAAGVAGAPRTTDGVESIFGINHLGHFLLVNLLLNVMGDEGRIVFVTSDLHEPPRFFPVTVSYPGARALAQAAGPGMYQYCTSKLCNLYNTYELSRLIGARTRKHITVNAFNPGAMSDTGFSRPTGNLLVRTVVRIIGKVMGLLIGKPGSAPESGAALAEMITAREYEKTTGRYIDRGVMKRSSELSYDLQHAQELWNTSMALAELDPSDTIFKR